MLYNWTELLQTLAEVNIGQFAGEAMNRIMGERKVPTHVLDYLVIGSTVPWHWKFWNAPVVASCQALLPLCGLRYFLTTEVHSALVGFVDAFINGSFRLIQPAKWMSRFCHDP